MGVSKEALRWREILPCLKRMCALGDDHMAEAKKKKKKIQATKEEVKWMVRLKKRRLKRGSDVMKK